MRHRQEDLLARRTIERTGSPPTPSPEGSRPPGAAATGPGPQLTLESTVPYLLRLGLLDLPSLVRHGLQIEEVPGRNRNFRVLGGPGQTFFLKQAPRGEIGTNGPLAVEASLYQWVAADAGAAGLRPVFPRRRHYDPERSILVLDLVTEAAHPYVLEDEASPAYLVALRRLVAAALAECHGLPARLGVASGAALAQTAPWVFDLARPAPASLIELAPAQLKVIQAVQSQPGAVAALDRLRDEWLPTGLIHGDFKWNNVLVQEDSAGIPVRVLLLDWEMAQLGDAAWDVGAALHALITEAVLGLDPTDGTGPEAAAGLLGAVIPRLLPAHRDFWSCYLAAARLPDAEAGAFLDRLPGHVAARLLKSAYEWSQAEVRMPRSAAAILQLGINMLLGPDEAREVVLGLGRRGSVRA
ncbi:MAG: aminoglycoside phosphotransferase family protein [Gemmatimonadales bacterium]